MRLNYCTLFDSGYLTRGLAMYNSLARQTKNFRLYIIAFDDKCEEILKSMKLANVVIISLSEFENKELLRVKKERTRGEYCWTCTSSSILYCIERYKLKNCTYIDADVYFFDDPAKLISKMGKNSVLITRHNYAKKYDHSKISGVYCVQFVTINNDSKGMKVLRWWVGQCIKWCYNRVEDGKFGDQKYLDDWTERFEGIYVLDDLGGGMAPWNAIDFKVFANGKKLRIINRINHKNYWLNFYHFHDIRFYRFLGFYRFVANKNFGYAIPRSAKNLVYKKYFAEIMRIQKILGKMYYGWGTLPEYIRNYTMKIIGI